MCKEIKISKHNIENLSVKCKELFPNGKAFILTDSNVGPLYLEKIKSNLENDGITVFSYVFPAGEENKNEKTLFEILDRMQEYSLTRSDFLIALGGGIVGDMGGLAAALFKRGIPVVQVPTTLLAMIDSSIGGKTGINTKYGKNLIGVFNQPAFTLLDSDFLSTLPEKEFTNGVAEIIKYGVIADKELFDKLKKGIDKADINEIIAKCVKIKTEIVKQDEKDNNLRLILNFGHTYGHAIEKLSGFEIPHGLAVAKGMVLAAKKSEKEGLCPTGTADKIAECCKANSLDTVCEYSEEELLEAASNDKKRTGNGLRFILIEDIGKPIF